MRNESKQRTPALSALPEPQQRPATPGRQRWFRLAALTGVPLAFLLTAELVLRLAGYGYPTRFFLEGKVNSQRVWMDNPAFGNRFFPPGLVRYPKPMTFPVAKPAGAVRVFVLGESAAMGDPDTKFGLPAMLEALLQNRYPGRHIEVVNAAMVAINSNVILPIARECARHDGDLWVIYMGNNEMIGPFGSISMFGAQTPPLPVIRATLALNQTRLGQLADALLRRLSRRRAPPEWGGMAMWADQQVAETDPRTRRVYHHFEANLEQILEAGCRAKVPILLCTIANNLKDCAPFGSVHTAGLSPGQLSQWEMLYQKGVSAETQANVGEADANYQAALAIDPNFADLWFRHARCCLALGQAPEFQRSYRQAREQDALQFRANDHLNEIIRRCAAAYASRGVQLLDVDQLFAANSPGGLPGRDYFLEHVHLNPEGNYLLARGVAEPAAALVHLGATGAKDWLDKAECLEAVGFTDWNRHDILLRILERVEEAPFTRQVNHADQLRSLREQIQPLRSSAKPVQLQRAARQLAQAVARRPDDPDLHWNLAQLLDLADDTRPAEAEWRTVIRLLPQASLPYYNLGKLLESHGRHAEALGLYQKSLRLNPDHFEARYATGLLLTRLGQPSKAVPWLRLAAQQRPILPQVHLALGTALQQCHQPSEADREFREVLRLDPGNQQARDALASLKGVQP